MGAFPFYQLSLHQDPTSFVRTPESLESPLPETSYLPHPLHTLVETLLNLSFVWCLLIMPTVRCLSDAPSRYVAPPSDVRKVEAEDVEEILCPTIPTRSESQNDLSKPSSCPYIRALLRLPHWPVLT